ncbi:hypothetical protein ACH436_14085 [Isoptericola sp. NPDC019693]|uniref:hypothetical protein n=1 Tax=Isoptericola sp. NPDC019693 TaxID=3364009 RepID=UPI0037BB774C
MSDSPAPGPARSPWTWRVVVLAAVVVVAVVVWLVVRDDGDDGATAAPPSPTATGTQEASASPDPSASPSTTGAAGCAETEDETPEGADTHEVVDVDGDGEADTAWLTGGAERRFGITTASGATFSAALDSASPQRASAVVNIVAAGDATAPVALVDTGREVLLFSAADCDLAATQNLAGAPYAFDEGFTGQGTGVGCTEVDGELHLAGLDATAADDGSFTVERTFVDLDDDALTASNGEPTAVATGAGREDPVVVTAQETSCGEAVAGQDGPVEPES